MELFTVPRGFPTVRNRASNHYGGRGSLGARSRICFQEQEASDEITSIEMGLQDGVNLARTVFEEAIANVMTIGLQTLEPLRDRHVVRKQLPQVLG
jgi:hypothetical protein